MTKKEQPKIDLKEAFREYARKELEFYKTAKKDKLYSRIIPNLKDKNSAMIDLYYNGIIIGGYITKQDIVINKQKVTKYGKEEDIPKAIKAIEDALKDSEMVLDNQLK